MKLPCRSHRKKMNISNMDCQPNPAGASTLGPPLCPTADGRRSPPAALKSREMGTANGHRRPRNRATPKRVSRTGAMRQPRRTGGPCLSIARGSRPGTTWCVGSHPRRQQQLQKHTPLCRCHVSQLTHVRSTHLVLTMNFIY
jgi:hypothetical protein